LSKLDVQRLDLNLLKVYLALMEEGSVTEVGERLGLAQSSISHALARLRATFDNPMFVRTTHGMRPTPLALSLLEPVRQALDGLQMALDATEPFDPRVSTREFKLLMPDIVEFLVMPRLLRWIHQENLTIRVVSNRNPLRTPQPLRTYRDALEASQADLAISVLPDKHRDFVQRLLFEDALACVMSSRNPLANHLTLDSYLDAPHLVVAPPATGDSLIKRALGRHASRRRIASSAPNHLVALFALTNTDMLAALPLAAAELFAKAADLTAVPLPFKVDPIPVRMFWHRALHDDAGCRWLRTALADLFTTPPLADVAPGTRDAAR